MKRSGKVKGYQLSDGRIISREEGVALAKDGEIKGLVLPIMVIQYI